MATSPRTKSSAGPKKAAGARRRRKAGGLKRGAARLNRTASAVKNDAGDLAHDIERIRDDLVKLSGSVSAILTGRADDARTAATDIAAGLYDTGLDYAKDAETQMRGMAGDLVKQIERNPLAAAGIVFGVGYLIGILRRR